MEARKISTKTAGNRPARGKETAARRAETGRWELPKPLLAIRDEHRYVARLLPLLEAEATRLKQGRAADYQCMADVMHYLTHYPDRYHHPKEELIFDRMSGAAPQTAKTIAKLRRDHDRIAVQGEALLAEILTRLDSGSRAGGKKLAVDILQYTGALGDHMRLEESAVFEPARNTLGEADWRAVDEAIAPVVDPLFGSRTSTRYLELMQRYINDFNTVSASGAVPVRLIESAASTLEQATHTAGEFRQLAGRLARTRVQIARDRLRLLGRLPKVRDRNGLKDWMEDAGAVRREGWERMSGQVKQALDACSASGDMEERHRELAAITLHTEDEICSFQETPLMPSRNPRISWQAALMNLVARATIKPMMSSGDMKTLGKDKRLKKHSQLVPAGTQVALVDEDAFHGVWITPEKLEHPRKTILHLPGGAFIAPASDMHRVMLGKLACSTGTRVMLVNYRLLPEHPFPAGLEDALAAYRYLLEQGVQPEEIVVSGDSAGGCLALAMMLALREEGLPLPAAAALLSPLTDLSFSTAARQANRWKDPMLPTRRKMANYARYAGSTSVRDPLVSPIYGSFEGFPPMFALVSSTETLLDDTLVVARKARSQGVDFDVQVWQNLPHDWPIFSFMPEADMALRGLADFCDHHLDPELPAIPRRQPAPAGRRRVRAA